MFPATISVCYHHHSLRCSLIHAKDSLINAKDSSRVNLVQLRGSLTVVQLEVQLVPFGGSLIS